MEEFIREEGVGINFKPFFAQKYRETTQNRRLEDKRMDVCQAIENFVKDGDYLASGGFGTNRIATALLHEVVRQGRKNLGFAGHTTTHDCQILVAGECFDRCDVAYVVGLEARGLSPAARLYFQSDKVTTTEWSNAALAWRFKAAAMGVSFLPASVMLGTDTFKYSAAKTVSCPFSGERYAAIPALAPDVALIHVHKADIYGNCQIEGLTVADADLAKASMKVVISAERIVSSDEIRQAPWKTTIPYWCVDAVCPVPYGAYPSNLSGEYFSDEEHLMRWMEAENNVESYTEFIDKYIRNTHDFFEYWELCGGLARMNSLRSEELMVGSEAEKRGQ